ncbi:MAG TPA: hypothetical protein VLY87_02925 [Flavobacterium sp.]|nr:hypothetical protein [Flavobacterium sp.]
MRYLLLFFLLNVFNGYSQSYLDFYFKSKGINGAILIYNENKDEWIFNKEDEPFLNTPPAAHYHLWMALVGLQEQVFSTEETKSIPWDGVKRSYFEERKPEWNSNTNLIQALNTQNDWYFGLLKYKLDEKKYSTSIQTNEFLKDIKNNELDYFWNYGVLTNPNTMILFLKDLYESKLPFNKQHQKYVFNSLLIDQKMALRTSSTSYLGKKIDWTIGVYFAKEKPVYFSLRTYRSLEQLDKPDYEKNRNLILTEIFDALNLISN